MKIFQEIINFLFPSFCLRCKGSLSAEEALYCISCLKSLPILKAYCRTCGTPLNESLLQNFSQEELNFCGNCLSEKPPFDRVFLAFKYESPIRELILQTKFNEDYALSYQLGRLLRNILPVDPKHYDLVLPIPLHPLRERERGYNQSLLILWGFMGVRLQRDYLQRIRYTFPQSELSFSERKKNVKDAFAVRISLVGKKVLLLDDVMTTGETLKEASRALKDAGAREVHVLAVARA